MALHFFRPFRFIAGFSKTARFSISTKNARGHLRISSWRSGVFAGTRKIEIGAPGDSPAASQNFGARKPWFLVDLDFCLMKLKWFSGARHRWSPINIIIWCENVSKNYFLLQVLLTASIATCLMSSIDCAKLLRTPKVYNAVRIFNYKCEGFSTFAWNILRKLFGVFFLLQMLSI